MISEGPKNVLKQLAVRQPARKQFEQPPGFFRAMFLYDRKFVAVLAVAAFFLLALASLFFRWIPGHSTGEGSRARLRGLDWILLVQLSSELGEADSKNFKSDVRLWKQRLDLDPWAPSAVRGYADSILESTNSLNLKLEVILPVLERLLQGSAMTEADVQRVLKLGLKSQQEEEMLLELAKVWSRLPAAMRDECLWVGVDLGEWDWVGQRVAAEKPVSNHSKWVFWAHEAVTGAGRQAESAVEELVRESKGAGASDVRLHQLVLQVAALRRSAALGLASFDRLRALKADRPVDHVRWVVCLAVAGDDEKAAGEVDRWGADLLVGVEVKAWVGAMESVHRLEQALSALEAAAIRAGRRQWWMLLVEKLVATKDWIGVRRVGTRFVGRNDFNGEWKAFGYALQAIAAQNSGSEEDLIDAEKWTGLVPVPNDQWTMKWAAMFDRLGYLKWASPWLLKTQAAFGEDIRYWRMRMRLAETEGDIKAFLLVVRKASALQPKDVMLRVDEANAMLVLHEDPEAALGKLESEEAIAAGGVSVQASRALAMIQLGRRTMAEGLIKGIVPKIQTDSERALVGLAQLQLARAMARPSEAWEISKKLDRSKLPLVFLPELEEARSNVRPGAAIRGSGQ